jgi:large-conductance mechanosensitive channel
LAFIDDAKRLALTGNAVDRVVAPMRGGAFGKVVTALLADVVVVPVAPMGDRPSRCSRAALATRCTSCTSELKAA